MKIKLLPLAVAALIATPAFAEPTLYGKANVAYQFADDGSDSVTELVSNASRIGVKGSEKLEGSNLEVIYQAEFQVDFADGDEGDSPFSQRNIFVGLKGDFGTVKAGKFDTPLKVSQNKIDLFNDLAGDIKHMVTVNDNRPGNVVQYSTPTASGFSGSFAIINSEDADVDNGLSGSVSYTQDALYVSLARDENVEAEDTNATRLVGQYSMGDIQLGALYEAYEAAGADSENGWLVSAKYKLDAWALKLQAGQSDINEAGGQTVSVGADRKLSKAAKLFFYYTAQESDAGTDDNFLGAGVEVKF
ncbi:porin [Saccharophagus degradans]|uniref:porin n=1 Tax=Saccharophagus degradans TaxID=86304 RepID=UPI001C0819DB|nr:porin [Saccharophagus degradans]MBU2984934.1 porin [Saccharophagus degradans]